MPAPKRTAFRKTILQALNQKPYTPTELATHTGKDRSFVERCLILLNVCGNVGCVNQGGRMTYFYINEK